MIIFYKKNSSTPSVNYPEAVEEALCFGWIDSKPNKRNDESYFQFFTKRKPKSTWSKINKEKVTKLTSAGLMTAAGLEAIETAMQNGSWTGLDNVENLTVPNDLQKLFNKNKAAFIHWEKFPRSSKKNDFGRNR